MFPRLLGFDLFENLYVRRGEERVNGYYHSLAEIYLELFKFYPRHSSLVVQYYECQQDLMLFFPEVTRSIGPGVWPFLRLDLPMCSVVVTFFAGSTVSARVVVLVVVIPGRIQFQSSPRVNASSPRANQTHLRHSQYSISLLQWRRLLQ